MAKETGIKFKNKTYYCKCVDPIYNITLYTDNYGDQYLTFPLISYIKCDFTLKNFVNRLYYKLYLKKKFKTAFGFFEGATKNQLKLYDFFVKVDNIFNPIIGLISIPFRILYNFCYYLFVPATGCIDILLDPKDETKVNKVISQFKLNKLTELQLVDKKELKFTDKLTYILSGRLTIWLTIHRIGDIIDNIYH